MRNRTSLLVLVIAQSLCAAAAIAQNGDGSRIFFDAVAFAGEASTPRLDLFLAVPYAAVSFERTAERFTSRYRVRLAVTSGSRTLFDSSFDRSTSTRFSEVAAAQRPAFDFFQHRLPLAPGAYEARVDIIDPRTSFVASARRTVTVVDYPSFPFALSGLLLAERIREDSSGFVMTPRLSDAITDASGYFLFFEVYNRNGPVDVRLEARYRAADGSVAGRQTFERSVPAGRSQQWVRMETEGTARGSYVLELQATRRDDTTAVLAVTERNVRIEGAASGIPVGEGELDERIGQLRHVAAPSEIETIREGTTVSERRRRYAEFWRRLDPTPGTPENEAMIEYFTRIDYAREHFRGAAAGWLTDQGRIYVIFGPPDRIERDPFRGDGRRIETWHYFLRSATEIVFEDESGFGDYRLLTPVSSLEKYRYGG